MNNLDHRCQECQGRHSSPLVVGGGSNSPTSCYVPSNMDLSSNRSPAGLRNARFATRRIQAPNKGRTRRRYLLSQPTLPKTRGLDQSIQATDLDEE